MKRHVVNLIALKKRLIFLLIIFIFIGGLQKSTAATITWVGGTSASWTKAANWSSGVVPGSADAVNIGGGTTYAPTVDGTYSCSSLAISSSVTLTLAGNLTVSGAITNSYGTVNFTTTGSGYTLTVGSISYNGSNAVITIGAGNSLVVSGVLTLGNSTSLANSGTVTVTSSANPAVTLTGGGGYIKNITATSHFTINGSISFGNSWVVNNAGFFTLIGNITNSGGGAITNSGTFNASACAYTPNNGDTFTNNPGGFAYIYGNSIWDYSNGGASISNSGTFYAGKSGSACTLNMGGYFSTISNSGTFYLGSTSIISFKSGSSINTNSNTVTNNSSGTFIIQSDANGSGTLAQSSGNAFSGTFQVQRYITGGGSGYRGYRFLSSPVNITDALAQTNQHNIGLSYLTAGMLTGGPGGTGGGFTMFTTNPLIYLFDEARPVNHLAYTGGENVGINSISGNTPAYSVVTIQPNTARTLNPSILVPVGNAYLVYYVGVVADGLNNTSPSSTTVTATGYLNQGTIPVYVTNGVASSTTMSYTPITTTKAATPGLHQIGNPYPSTIDLKALYNDNSGSITSIFDELQEPNGAYVSYNASSGGVSSSSAGEYIVSGQGFFVHATGTTKLTFYEDEKVSNQLTSLTTQPLLLNQKSKTVSAITAAELLPASLSGLHLQLNQDSLTHTQTGIYFSPSWSDKYVPQEDAMDEDGTSVYLSSYSSDNQRLSINQLGDYSAGRKIVKLYVSAASYGAFNLSLADIKNIDTLYNVYLRDHL